MLNKYSTILSFFCLNIFFPLMSMEIVFSSRDDMKMKMPESEKDPRFLAILANPSNYLYKSQLSRIVDNVHFTDGKDRLLIEKILWHEVDVDNEIDAFCQSGHAVHDEVKHCVNFRDRAETIRNGALESATDTTALYQLCGYASNYEFQTVSLLERIRVLLKGRANPNFKPEKKDAPGTLAHLFSRGAPGKASFNFLCVAALLLLNAGANPNGTSAHQNTDDVPQNGQTQEKSPWIVFLEQLHELPQLTDYCKIAQRRFLAQGADDSTIPRSLFLKIQKNQPLYRVIDCFKEDRDQLFKTIELFNTLEAKKKVEAYEKVRTLVQRIPLAIFMPPYNNTPLHHAVRYNALPIVVLFFGIMPHLALQKNGTDMALTPLMLAIDGKRLILKFFMNMSEPEINRCKQRPARQKK